MKLSSREHSTSSRTWILPFKQIENRALWSNSQEERTNSDFSLGLQLQGLVGKLNPTPSHHHPGKKKKKWGKKDKESTSKLFKEFP